MKKIWNSLLIIMLFIYAAALVFFSFAYYEYKHLTVQDNIHKSDVIIVYGTDRQQQLLEKAKQRYHKGFGKKIIVSPFIINEKNNSLTAMERADINKSSVIPDYYSTDMKQSVENNSIVMSKNDWQSALIIANDYEMKRLIKTYEKNDVIHRFNFESVKSDQDSQQYHQAASHEVWQLPKLWLNR